MQGSMIRRTIRTMIGSCCRFSGVLFRAERINLNRLTILCYHRVMPTDRKALYFCNDLVVTPESFRQHCRILLQHYDVLPLSEAMDSLRHKSTNVWPIAVMTFDDGYCDNYEYALPILNEFGLRATFFVIAGLVDTTASSWYDRLARSIDGLKQQGRIKAILQQPDITELLGSCMHQLAEVDGIRHKLVTAAKSLSIEKRQVLLQQLGAASGYRQNHDSDDRIMTWRQLSELTAGGHEIGSHSLTHEILPQLDDTSLESEITGSRKLLEERLNRRVRVFCYPNGGADDRVIQAVDQGGYDYAVTTTPGCNEPTQNVLRLKRWFMHEDRLRRPMGATSATLLRMQICGLADRAFRRRQVQVGIL